MLVKIEARILIFPCTDFHFPSTSVPPGTFFRLCQTSRVRLARPFRTDTLRSIAVNSPRGIRGVGPGKENEGYGGKDLQKRKVLNV